MGLRVPGVARVHPGSRHPVCIALAPNLLANLDAGAGLGLRCLDSSLRMMTIVKLVDDNSLVTTHSWCSYT